jgi:hypothetical protein
VFCKELSGFPSLGERYPIDGTELPIVARWKLGALGGVSYAPEPRTGASRSDHTTLVSLCRARFVEIAKTFDRGAEVCEISADGRLHGRLFRVFRKRGHQVEPARRLTPPA